MAALAFSVACGGSSEHDSKGSGGHAGAGSAGSNATGGRVGNGGAATNAGADTAGSSSGNNGKTPCYGGCNDTTERPVPLPRPVCPSSEPSDGAACSQAGLRCSYGDSRAPQCRHIYDCKSGSWALDPSLQQRYSCEPLPADYCPATPQHEMPCVIATPGLTCSYGNLSCACAAQSPAPGKPGNWVCYGPPANPACPALAPNLGEGCKPNGLACDYDIDGCNAAKNSSLFCFDGAWEQGEGYNCAN